MSTSATRTRIAPSPTGFLHIGNLRTALYSYALAKKNGGQFILRIEDTDRSRFIPAAVDYLLHIFEDFGLYPDESPKLGGPYAPYTQSERLDSYKQIAIQLIEEGKAFRCFLSPEEIEELTAQARASNSPFRSPHRDLDAREAAARAAAREPHTIRFKVSPGEELTFADGVQGSITYRTDELEDWVMLKSDGFPTYNFAVVVDDHVMQVSHVLRGVEFVSSIPKNVLLYKALNWDIPEFFHLPVLMEPTGGKLSKRKGAVNAGEFLAQGYLPAAVLNFLMLLGWSSPEQRSHGQKEREIFSLQEFIDLFDVADLNKSNPVFNREKLLWFNQQYIQSTPNQELINRLGILKQVRDSREGQEEQATQSIADHLLANVLADAHASAKLDLVKERARTLLELVEAMQIFYVEPGQVDWGIKQLADLSAEQLPQVLQELHSLHQSMGNSQTWTHPEWEQAVRTLADKHSIKHGQMFMVLRMAVAGSPVSPPLFECLQIIGEQQVLARIKNAQSTPS